jgi:hypothetical protein
MPSFGSDQVGLFIDWENLAISLDRQYSTNPDPKLIVQCLTDHVKTLGTLAVSGAYADWERFPGVPNTTAHLGKN